MKGMNKLAASIHGGEDVARSQVDKKKSKNAGDLSPELHVAQIFENSKSMVLNLQ